MRTEPALRAERARVTLWNARKAPRAPFAVLLGVSLAVPHAVRAGEDLRLGRAVVPVSEGLRLVLDADKTNYTGSAHLVLDVKGTSPSFRMHAEDMTLTHVSLQRLGKNDKPTGAAITATTTPGSTGLVTIAPASPLAVGRWALDIDFENDFGTKAVGLYRMQSGGKGYLFTQFEADDAREAIPCFDEPQFKIPWDLTLVAPEKHLVLFNSPIAKQTVKSGQRTTVFRRTPPLPSYLVALAAGPLETVDIPGCGVPARIVTVQGQSHLAGLAVQAVPPIVRALERWFDQKYPYEKLDLLAVPEYWFGAMENPGAITFSDRLLLLSPDAASPAQRSSLARVTAHELAHMWFGDYVTMTWWDDLWLNESFADWMGDKITEEVFPEFDLAKTELLSIQNVMNSDARPSAQAVHRPVDASEDLLSNVGTQYNKGKCVLGMFEQWVGAESFRKGVLDYLQAHAWGNATAGDLWASLSKVSGQDVSGAMATFVDQAGIPLVTVEPQPDGSLQLTQSRTHNAGVEIAPQSWKIPVALKYSDGAATHTETVLLETATRNWRPAGGARVLWVLPNADARGYYRWNVPAAMLANLTESPTTTLTAMERIGLMGNVGALLEGGFVHGDDYCKTLARFAGDPEPHVISALASNFDKVKGGFVTEDLEDAFALYIRRTLGPSIERWGIEPKPGEAEAITLVRPKLLEWLGEDGRDPQVRARAAALARSYLEDPKAVDASIVGAVIPLAAMQGDRALFDEYRQRFETTQLPVDRSRFLNGLGSFRDPELMNAALEYCLSGPLRPTELTSIPFNISDPTGNRDLVMHWLMDHYDAFASRLPKEFSSFLVYMGRGCDTARMDATRTFFSDPSRDSLPVRTNLAKLSDAVSDCARMREREGGAVATYLTQLVGAR